MAVNLSHVFKKITVEPIYFLYLGIYIIIDATNSNLLLQKKCRFNITSEPNLDIPCVDEKPGILLVSEVNSFYRLTMMIFCMIFSIFAMSWSDAAGRRRRPLILLPIVGQIFQALAGCVHAYFWSWPPINAALTNFTIEMLTGGLPLMMLATQTYLSDISTVESRTMRFGVFTALKILGDLFGYGSNGFILRSVGFFYTNVACFVLSVVTLILAMYFVKDTSIPVNESPGVWRIFSFNRIVDSFKVVFSRSLGKKRILVSVLLVIHILVMFSTYGEKIMLYLFLRHKFHWDERQFSSYVLYRYTGATIGSAFCSLILSERLKIHDGLIGVFAGAWDTIAAIGYLFASQNWHLYVVPIFDIFHGTALAVSYSFCSKYYSEDQLGRLNSVIGVFMLSSLGCQPTYNIIFQNTLDVFPSAYFLLSIVLDVVIVLLYGATYILCKKIDKKRPIKKEEEAMIVSQ